MKLMLRIGGSVLGSPPSPAVVNDYAQIVSTLREKAHYIGIVVGGGEISRMYIETAKKLGFSTFNQDIVAIHASRLNAKLVSIKLGDFHPVPTTINGMLSRLRKNKAAVMGGLRPGITTDTVATIVAEEWKSDLFIKASDQEGIYTADPMKHKDAKLLKSISYQELKTILAVEYAPGIHSIIDPVAVGLLLRSRLKLVVLDGRNPKNILRVVKGEKVGTTIS